MNLFNGFFENKKILITGDTGFKGSWLAIWLIELGAEVYGYALPPIRENDNYCRCGLSKKIRHFDGDVREREKMLKFFQFVQPDIAFHLAAQPIVLESYNNPHYTFETNIMGTVNFFEAVLQTNSVKAAINITSDKCYQNNEWIWGYRETDPLGGKDPYSASKGCSEIVTNSYVQSFLLSSNCSVATARAGNVIGGGDWAENRIIPDFFRAAKKNDKLIIRNPNAIRPWQHVLEPLSGYLLLASKLYCEKSKYSGAWNFGPSDQSVHTVFDIINAMIKCYGNCDVQFKDLDKKQHEASLLKLDTSKSFMELDWKSVLSFEETVEFTVEGYLHEFNEQEVYKCRFEQIMNYVSIAKERKIRWAS